MDIQLEQFKTDISLPDYAATVFSYQIDEKESYASQIIMRASDGSNKISISKMADGHWVYYSYYDTTDHGSIIDFVQNRRGGRLQYSLGQVRKELSTWSPSVKSVFRSVQPIKKDRFRVVQEYDSFKVLSSSQYLASRAVGKEIVQHSRFSGKMKLDQRNNVIFPHFDQHGVCGFERKNWKFQGFVKGGEKSLWMSNKQESDDRLVICESVIDCLSYHVLFGAEGNRYIATSGQWSPLSSEMLRHEVSNFQGRFVVLAFDNDEQGKRFVWECKVLLGDLGKGVLVHFPEMKDWNEVLRGDVNISKCLP